MLDHQKTTLAKLKQAYGLNSQEAETLLAALAPEHDVFLYDTWKLAQAFWKKALTHRSTPQEKYLLSDFPEPPEIVEELQYRLAAGWLLTYLYKLNRIFPLSTS